MSEKMFNLIDENWIKVMQPDCTVREVSLLDAILEAHHYVSLAGEMEAQNIALLRMMIALVHTVFTRVNVRGEEDPVEDGQTALSRWADLKNNGFFPREPVQKYLQTWHDRFWLFHETHPFYQVPAAKSGTSNTVAKLNGEVSESNNKARLFSFLNKQGKKYMTFSESARWLLFINGFDDCAAKQKDKTLGSRSFTTGWLGKLGLVTAVGKNLFETMLLNMPMLNHDLQLWDEDDLPAWELPAPCEEERRTIPVPGDLASLYTLQSRRILLIRDENWVVGYGLLGGDAFSEKNALAEPMTLWRREQEKKDTQYYYVPKRHDRARQIWRDFGSLVNLNNEEAPGIVNWCKELQVRNLISSRQMVTFRIICVRYDSSQSSSITDSFSDALSFHAELLTDAGTGWIMEINNQLELIEKAAGIVGHLAYHLGKACNQGDDRLKSESTRAKEQFYLAIDQPFRDWLFVLDPSQDSDERLGLINDWKKQARIITLQLGKTLVEEKGEPAYIGRSIEKDEKSKKKEKIYYSSPKAYNEFVRDLSSVYPVINNHIQEGEEAHA